MTVSVIKDFGEFIPGAHKDQISIVDNFDLDTLTTINPVDAEKCAKISKIFPEPDYNLLITEGMSVDNAAIIKCLRESCKTPTRDAGKNIRKLVQLKDTNQTWAIKTASTFRGRLLDNVQHITDLRTVAIRIMSGMDFYQKAEQYDLERLRDSFKSKVRFYIGMGFPNKLPVGADSHTIRVCRITEDKGMQYYARKGNRKIGDYHDSEEGAIEALKVKLLENPNSKKKIKFDGYKYHREDTWTVGKKVGGKNIDLIKNIPSKEECIRVLNEDYDKLVDILTKIKDIPEHRYDKNRSRAGPDYRRGANISPVKFQETFGFRGVQFGNSTGQKKRQQDLNNTYDALLDLSGALGIKPSGLSLNGSLALAFGARGRGGRRAPCAHFEPGQTVINLTKNNGAGSLAHEFWHGLDNALSRITGIESDYMSERLDAKSSGALAEMHPSQAGDLPLPVANSIAELMGVIKKTNLPGRCTGLDHTRTKEYWGTPVELSARCFESYIKDKLSEKEIKNDFLVNIIAFDDYRSKPNYPYLKDDEKDRTYKKFDRVFDAIKNGVSWVQKAEQKSLVVENDFNNDIVFSNKEAPVKQQSLGF